MKNRKGFDWYGLKHRYSFWKYHFGLASVLLGALLASGTEAKAEESEISNDQSAASGQLEEVETSLTEAESTAFASEQPILLTPSMGLAQEGSEGLTVESQPSASSNDQNEEEEIRTSSSLFGIANESALTKASKEAVQPTGESASTVASTSEVNSEELVQVSQPSSVVSVPTSSSKADELEVEVADTPIKESVYKILTAVRLKEMSPQEISQLGIYDLGDFKMTRELFAQLSDEQVRALTFNRSYQNLRQGVAVSGGSFRAATETSSNKPNDGYSTSERKLIREGYSPYLDPRPDRTTVLVSENVFANDLGDGVRPKEIGRQYTFSVSKEDVDKEGFARYLYVTVTQNGGVLNTLTIDATQLSNGQVIALDQSADGSGPYSVLFVTVSPITGIPSLRIQKRMDNAAVAYLQIYGTNMYTQTHPASTHQVKRGIWRTQITKFLEDETNKELYPTFVQYGWDELTNYTTKPVDIKGYELVRIEGNENYTINSEVVTRDKETVDGVERTVLYKRNVTTRGTAYRKLTLLEDGKTKVEAYITWAKAPGTFSTSVNIDKDRIAAELPEAKDFFNNKDKYFIYDDIDKTQEEQTRRSDNGIKGIVEFIQLRYKSPTGSTEAPTVDEYATAAREVVLEPFTASNSRYNLGRTYDVNNSVFEPDDVIYYYRAKTANVFVTYTDTDGNPLKIPQNNTYVEKVTDVRDGKYDSEYNTSDHKPNTIKTEDGRTYKLAVAGNYTVGAVDNNNHLVSSAPVSGKVKEEDQTVTYVYQEAKGDVVVLYRVNGTGEPITGTSSDGKTIGNVSDTETEEKRAWEGAIVDTSRTSTGTNYSTIDNRPAYITTADGKIYRRVENNVGGVEEGKVVEGTTRIVYNYELVKGSVRVHYVDENGKQLNPPVMDEENADTGTAYNTSDRKLSTILTAEGKEYELVPAGTYPISKVDGEGHLESTDPTSGKVAEGTKEVTYVYREVKKDKAVIVYRYIDAKGDVVEELERTSEFEGRGGTGVPYTEETKQGVIDKYLKQGYKLVKDEYGPGKTFDGQDGVDTYHIDLTPKIVPFEPNKPVKPGEEVPTDPDKPNYPDPSNPDAKDPNALKRTVTRTVTYYTEDADGNNRQPVSEDRIPTKTDTLHFRRTGTINLVTGEVMMGDWTLTDDKYEETTEIKTGEFKDYENPSLEGYTLHSEEVDRGTSTSTEATGAHTRVQATDEDYHDKVIYRPIVVPKGHVVVHYKDTKGTTIKDDYKDTEDSPVGEGYNTGENDSEKPPVIESNGRKYILVPDRTEGSEIGKVVEGTTEVTYVYQQVGGEVKARYVIEGGETELQNSVVVKPADSPIGEVYQGTRPETIEKDGHTYVLSAANPVRMNQGDAPESGEVKEGEQTIVYQYVLKETPQPEVKKGRVVVHYVNEAGETIAADVVDTPESDVDTPYDTSDHKPQIIEKDGKRYLFTKVQDGDQETGKVVEGETSVTYVYKELGSYLPYIPGVDNPGDRPPVPYDDTPLVPGDNPPLPYIPGYTPKDPDGNPLKPVDPTDPSKGYVPPSITDPNDP
ncbi:MULTISPECIES: MucBP domain-containing protein, partial [unclassified Streptococcus]|uniref:MucBP domain-containing protein n=2 Tax=unclassified Streptococcus TaxID=2608887 RepID=UPI001071A25B